MSRRDKRGRDHPPLRKNRTRCGGRTLCAPTKKAITCSAGGQRPPLWKKARMRYSSRRVTYAIPTKSHQADAHCMPHGKWKAQRRGRWFRFPNSFSSGAEAKRSFAESSLLSFLSRKRERLPGRDTATAGAHIKSWKISLSAYRGRKPPRCGGWAPHRWNRW